MKCSHCGNEITGNDFVEWEGHSFCNPVHRYSYKQSHSPPPPSEPEEAHGFRPHRWSIAGGAAGLLVGLYSGIHVIVPFLLLIGVAQVLNRTNTVAHEARSIIALLSAQFGWLSLGAVMTGAWDQVYIDLLFIGAGTIWLLKSLNAVPVIILLLFQFGVLLINADLILQTEPGSGEHKALVVHIVLRIMLLISLSIGLFSLRRRVQRPQ